MHHHAPHPPANPAPANPHNNQQIKSQHPPTKQQPPQPPIPISIVLTAKLPPQPRTQIPQPRRAPVRLYTSTAQTLPRPGCGAGGTRQVELFNVLFGFVEEGVEDVGGGDVAGRGGGRSEEGGECFGEFWGEKEKRCQFCCIREVWVAYRWRRRRVSGLVVMRPRWSASARGSCLSAEGGEASCWWTTMAMNVSAVGVGCDGGCHRPRLAMNVSKKDDSRLSLFNFRSSLPAYQVIVVSLPTQGKSVREKNPVVASIRRRRERHRLKSVCNLIRPFLPSPLSYNVPRLSYPCSSPFPSIHAPTLPSIVPAVLPTSALLPIPYNRMEEKKRKETPRWCIASRSRSVGKLMDSCDPRRIDRDLPPNNAFLFRGITAHLQPSSWRYRHRMPYTP